MDRSKPIIALDFSTMAQVENFMALFEGLTLNVKVGMELFYAVGPDIIRYLKKGGHDIFLDLKLHDIPNTVKSSMRVLAKLGVAMVNVHAAGGEQMMRAAKAGLLEGAIETLPLLIAVTQLTSTSELAMQEEQKIPTTLEESVINYARLAQRAGLDGVVCSPHEASIIRREIGQSFCSVTPGIRLSTSTADDQHRIATPQQAALLGSDYIVVGRPVTRSENPRQAYLEILSQWQNQ